MREIPLRRYADRHDAGQVLAEGLAGYRGDRDALVLGLPRGGVPVAFEVAQSLDAPLDVLIVRKLGAPGHEEFAIGAIASGGICVRNPDVGPFDVPQPVFEAILARERAELERRERQYRDAHAPPRLAGRKVILVDDGLATGSTMRAAVQAVRQRDPARVIVAVPVGARATCEALRREADEVVCPLEPDHLRSVGEWYDDFDATSDAEVRALLSQAWHERAA
jgi:predicted phosphoribosyltransferase